MSRKHNDPYYNFEQVDAWYDRWALDFERKLHSARGKLLIALLCLSGAVVGTQFILKVGLREHPVRPALQTILYGAYAGTGIFLTDLLRVRKQADRGWTTIQQVQIESREDFGTNLAERKYSPYVDDEAYEEDIAGGISRE